MPLFADRFTFRKSPPRKLPSLTSGYRPLAASDARSEFGPEVNEVSITLDGRRAVLDEASGKWVWVQEESPARDSERLQRVTSENRLLRLKIEILTDLVSRCALLCQRDNEECARSCRST